MTFACTLNPAGARKWCLKVGKSAWPALRALTVSLDHGKSCFPGHLGPAPSPHGASGSRKALARGWRWTGGWGWGDSPARCCRGLRNLHLPRCPLLNIPACDSSRGTQQLFCAGPGVAGAGRPLPTTSEPLSEAVTSLPRPCRMLGGQEGRQEGGQRLGLREGLAQSAVLRSRA